MSQFACAVLGAALRIGGALVAIASRYLPRPRPVPPVPVPGALAPMGYRWCPAELRTVAAVLHPDGSARCADPACATHIPATEG